MVRHDARWCVMTVVFNSPLANLVFNLYTVRHDARSTVMTKVGRASWRCGESVVTHCVKGCSIFDLCVMTLDVASWRTNKYGQMLEL